MEPCQTIPGTDAFASNVLQFLDCQAATLGAGGYQALAAGGSSISILIGVLISIFIAFWGYRLLLGEVPTLRDIVLAVVKVGIVLTLASSWPAYQTLIYDVTLRTPAQLANEIDGPLEGADTPGALPARLDAIGNGLQRLAALGAGQPHSPAEVAEAQAAGPGLFLNFDNFALGAARLAYLIGALASFALVRLAAGVLLAAGPLFVAFFLFDATRGFSIGWLRALVGVALAALAATLVLTMELALLEPWVASLLARRLAEQPIFGVPGELLAVAIVFTLALFGTMVIVMRVAGTIQGPSARAPAPGQAPTMIAAMKHAPLSLASEGSLRTVDDRTRADVLAGAIVAAQRREAAAGAFGGRVALAGGTLTAGDGRSKTLPDTLAAVPLGQSYRRRTTNRHSASAARRDRRS